jgi:hypothetical protein
VEVRRALHPKTILAIDARLRDELLDGEIFYSLREAVIVIESWRRHNTVRPHASIGYRAPAPEVVRPRAGTHSRDDYRRVRHYNQ